MSTEDTTSTQETPPEAPPAASGKRERPPPSPEKARRAAAAKRLKRAVEKALESDDPEAMERAAAALSGGASVAASAPSAEPGAALVPAETPAVAAPMPSAEELAAMTQLANGLFAMVAAPLQGTKFDPMVPRPNPLGGEAIVPAQAVVQAAGPVLAKYLPSAVATPEGQLALALALWLVPPALEMATARVMGEGSAASAEGAGIKAA
ncbi:hypothetical protein CYFUS_001707 [Cystobacter fuscus]|uniref:Uncharacterized protein n=1 Tax=Cystobacter fuscus TaxID=43 RepID=A0A250IYC0_9BACT|nr:hypothetical protein [Cystobacter fuscus]ATB36293.1 hypothetical protein CYFUS_001707 [Cystobacter fuscus]